MRQRVRGKWSPFVGLGTDLGHIFSHPLDSVGYTVAHTTGSRKLVRHVAMELICEPDPDPNSRVTLSDDIDALGMRRAKVDWRLGQQVKDTVDTSFSLLAKELEDKNIAKVKLGPRINDTGWPATWRVPITTWVPPGCMTPRVTVWSTATARFTTWRTSTLPVRRCSPPRRPTTRP